MSTGKDQTDSTPPGSLKSPEARVFNDNLSEKSGSTKQSGFTQHFSSGSDDEDSSSQSGGRRRTEVFTRSMIKPSNSMGPGMDPFASFSGMRSTDDMGVISKETRRATNLQVPDLIFKDMQEWVEKDECFICKLYFQKFKLSLKHHCRVCGQSVCGQCSAKAINSLRACDKCFLWYRNQANDGFILEYFMDLDEKIAKTGKLVVKCKENAVNLKDKETQEFQSMEEGEMKGKRIVEAHKAEMVEVTELAEKLEQDIEMKKRQYNDMTEQYDKNAKISETITESLEVLYVKAE
eukprot:TRINITY_DN2781_c0_g3_i1.p1 TRINITY_DN2781_c0_g3~~TRINITY_DN2781_c0_g3_i1.p1  ORF type:complete len:292 (-),score=47.44 TRINITY_DN2781_c0_g3_i1:650-1525(-)